MSNNSKKRQTDIREVNQVVKMIYLITQIGFTIMVTIFLCIGIGYILEKKLGIHAMIWCILVGVIASMRSAYILIRRSISFENPDDEYERLMSGKNKEFSTDGLTYVKATQPADEKTDKKADESDYCEDDIRED